LYQSGGFGIGSSNCAIQSFLWSDVLTFFTQNVVICHTREGSRVAGCILVPLMLCVFCLQLCAIG